METGKPITLEELNRAFDKAEDETAKHFDGKTCSMENHYGNTECPICHFRAQVKELLGFVPLEIEYTADHE